MYTPKKLFFVLPLSLLVVTTGGLFATWSFQTSSPSIGEEKQLNINIDENWTFPSSTYNVNYYMPDSLGNFSLYYSETVSVNTPLTHVPSTPNISQYVFNAWSTSSLLADSFDISSNITSNMNLYSRYVGYFVKGSGENNYQLLNIGSGTADRYLGNGSNVSTPFSFNYTLGNSSETSWQASTYLVGDSVAIYSSYLGGNSYTKISSDRKLVNGINNDQTMTGNYKIYYNSNNNELYTTRTIFAQVKKCYNDPKIHFWSDTNSGTSWPGLTMTYISGNRGDTQEFRIDADTSMYNNFIFNNGYGNQTGTLDLSSSPSTEHVWIGDGNSGDDYSHYGWY